MKGRERIIDIAGIEPATILLPLQQNYIECALQHLTPLQVALEGYGGIIKVHYSSHKMFNQCRSRKISFIQSETSKRTHGVH